jgi:Golgi SNAP receptor complex protein 1
MDPRAVNQREAIKLVQKKLNDLTNRFPVINSLVNRINLRKRRDTIILGLVVGLCLVFLIWWALA